MKKSLYVFRFFFLIGAFLAYNMKLIITFLDDLLAANALEYFLLSYFSVQLSVQTYLTFGSNFLL